MSLLRSIVFTAALVGLVAGLVMTALQQFGTQPLIVQAEVIEEANAAKAATPHDHAAAGEHDHAALTAQEEAAAAGHHGADEWAPADGAERFGWTLAANIVAGIGFALLLVAASELRGGLTSWREGLLWGLAGFAVFTLAPSIGLPPEAPGVEGAPSDGPADLVDRHGRRDGRRPWPDRLRALAARGARRRGADRRPARDRRAKTPCPAGDPA